MWRDITNEPLQWAAYAAVLYGSGPHYVSTIDQASLRHVVEQKRGRLYLYESGRVLIALGFKYTESTGQWRILHCIPSGIRVEDAAATMRIAFRQIRKVMDSLKVEAMYATRLATYPDPITQTFLDYVREGVWELAEEVTDEAGVQWVFRRDPGRRREDEKWTRKQGAA